jgi:hypothetical protein
MTIVKIKNQKQYALNVTDLRTGSKFIINFCNKARMYRWMRNNYSAYSWESSN